MEYLTSFTIILSFVGISVSFASLIFSIIYLVKIFKLEKSQKEIEDIIEKLDIIKKSLISSCLLFVNNGTVISGEEVIKKICKQYDCDEWTAINIFKASKKLNLDT